MPSDQEKVAETDFDAFGVRSSREKLLSRWASKPSGSSRRCPPATGCSTTGVTLTAMTPRAAAPTARRPPAASDWRTTTPPPAGLSTPTTTTSTVHDAVGRRMNYTVTDSGAAAESVRYAYAGWDLVSTYGHGGPATNHYVHGPGTDRVLAQRTDGGGTLHGLADHQGSVTDFAVVDGPGGTYTAGHRDYDAFGVELTTSYSGNWGGAVAGGHLFGYTGRERTGVPEHYDYRMRGYDAASGRFLQTDPLGLRAGDTNLYRYVGNSAPGYIDPLGLGVKPFQGAYPGPAESPERRAPGEVAEACTCTCVCGQLNQASNQTGTTPPPSDTSASDAPSVPGGTVGGSAGRGPTPGGAAGGGTNLMGYAGGNPAGASDPSGLAAVSLAPYAVAGADRSGYGEAAYAASNAKLYGYVRNQPVSMADPSGLEPPSVPDDYPLNVPLPPGEIFTVGNHPPLTPFNPNTPSIGPATPSQSLRLGDPFYREYEYLRARQNLGFGDGSRLSQMEIVMEDRQLVDQWRREGRSTTTIICGLLFRPTGWFDRGLQLLLVPGTPATRASGATRTSSTRPVRSRAPISSAEIRAREILEAVPEPTQGRTTIAVTETAEGTRIISTSEGRLRPAQRRLLGPNEIEAVGPGHAEMTGLNTAADLRLTPTGTAASRPICEPCAGSMSQRGVDFLSPLRPPTRSR